MPCAHSFLFFGDFHRLQRKPQKPDASLPPLTSTSAEEDSLSLQPAAATEELAQELSSPPPNQEVPEPPLLIQTTATILSIPEVCKVSGPSTAPPAQGETPVLPVQVLATLQPGDTEFTEPQEVSPPVPLSSAPQPALTATSPPLNSVVSSALFVQAAPTQTAQPEVE